MWLIHVLNFFFFLPKLLGSPDDASLGFLRSDNARRYVRQLPQCRRQQLSARFPSMSPGALDLLEKMLVFDPTKRITGTSIEFKFSRETLTGYCFESFVPLSLLYLYLWVTCSWRGTLSPILVISPWYEWWACLCQAVQFWFWATNMYWRTNQRAHLEGVSEV